ncbi:methyl-accepting chemotaxis protein [Pseudobacteriovorax antillogorgiicola]|uniref:Methyl-accepting chemotaxis protein n=1 Tax=Pseudobacteriovorax antillogorgiicola TaxID=1513793 RepID=A0A1Y6BB75_9BACT|nr:methyl-accepting chemotaxis protein [Pseudobacteriovorax antillogorgiicola]TCS57432.1 methyl-accepting chemotaxis protein [Pseudobacteriovorax antillogorgiicola]SMF01188.1 methyl-accepting chemotaxis protein [Pseudobacteriovorax antillogorgiicola]
MNKKLRALSLNSRLLLFAIGLSWIFVSISIVVGKLVVESTVESIAEKSLESGADLLTSEIESSIERYAQFSRKLSQDRLIEGLFLAYESAFYGSAFFVGEDHNIYTEAYKKLDQRYLERVEAFRVDNRVQDIFLISREGQVIMATLKPESNPNLGKNLREGSLKGSPLASCFEKALTNSPGTLCNTGFFLDRASNQIKAFQLTRSDAEFEHLSEGISRGDVMGVVAIELNTEFLQKVTDFSQKFGETTQAFVINDEQKLLTDVIEENQKLESLKSFQGDVSLKHSYIKNIKDDRSLYGQFEDHFGNDVFVIGRPIAGFNGPWYFAFEKAAREVYQPINQLLISLILAFGLALLGILYLAKIFAKQITDPLMGANRSVGALANNLGHDSETVSQEALKMSEGAQDVAASVQETVSSMSEINSMVSSTLEKTSLSTQSAAEIETQVDTGARQMSELVDAMREIDQSNNQLENIKRFMSDIEKQTGLINDIVFKTQLLSVNASIESAKAGEHGKGFSVVANEVSKLADTSGVAAGAISDLIDSIKNQVTELLEANKAKIAVGQQKTESVMTLFSTIRKEVEHIKTRVEDVSMAAKEQSVGINEITTAVGNIEHATQLSLEGVTNLERLTASLASHSRGLTQISGKLESITLGQKVSSDQGPKERENSTPVNSGREDSAPRLRSLGSAGDVSADDDSFKSAG